QSRIIDVYDARGRVIISKSFNGPMVSLDVRTLAEGAYFCKLRSTNSSYTSTTLVISRN
ncbi:MAG: T9SS type A sorting domain-containing protein, partial [Flavobacteriales bacterium]|nr:T9SS type A sorting domain-containing protein [Flavobacteriales bacterium]